MNTPIEILPKTRVFAYKTDNMVEIADTDWQNDIPEIERVAYWPVKKEIHVHFRSNTSPERLNNLHIQIGLIIS